MFDVYVVCGVDCLMCMICVCDVFVVCVYVCSVWFIVCDVFYLCVMCGGICVMDLMCVWFVV